MWEVITPKGVNKISISAVGKETDMNTRLTQTSPLRTEHLTHICELMSSVGQLWNILEHGAHAASEPLKNNWISVSAAIQQGNNSVVWGTIPYCVIVFSVSIDESFFDLLSLTTHAFECTVLKLF